MWCACVGVVCVLCEIMKVVSWNVNGLRATLKGGSSQDLRGLLDGLGADIICFQETKATRVNRLYILYTVSPHIVKLFLCTGEQLDESLYLVDGYNAYFSFCRTKKGYSGIRTWIQIINDTPRLLVFIHRGGHILPRLCHTRCS